MSDAPHQKAQPFLDMAARIGRMDPADFAGALLVVPPGEGAEPVAMLLIDPTPALAHFMLSAKGRVESWFNDLSEKLRSRDPYRR
jgi:hypothetical protein